MTRNPATGEDLEAYPTTPAGDVEDALAAATSAQADWAHWSFSDRGRGIEAVARRLEKNADQLARLMAQEMGKPVDQGAAETAKSAWVCDYYAEGAAEFLADEPVATDAQRSFVAYRPLGTILAVMPWNFPLWQVLRCAAPSLMAGNAVVLKHSPNVTGCALALQDLMTAELPAGLFQTLVLNEAAVAPLIADPRVQAVTLTGSPQAGRAVARAAGAHLKKSVLELGGSDPYIVLADADLDLAARECVASRLINTGQSCIAAKRLIVVDAVRSDFTDRCVAAMTKGRTGPPLESPVDLGPLARSDLRLRLHRQVQGSMRMGAHLVAGGALPEGPGFFYPPTVLTDVAPGMPAFDEETFGPVAAIVPARDEDTAVDLANASPFGLGAAVFTADVDHGEDLARRRLRAGCAFVNAFVRSDPRLPFGGIGMSGYGRELSPLGIKEFVNAKTVYVA
ncbi:MAG: NAD-dependent succinate-semialdehyde dehydrogenase [Anaerolineae bacterium]